MQLSKLLSSLGNYDITGDVGIEISSVTDNTQKIVPGCLFIAIKGFTVDGHNFIPQAVKAGALAIIGEQNPKKFDLQGRTYIKVKNSRFSLGKIASSWFDNPSQKLKVIGVTGTEGKTTTASLIYHIFQTSGKKTGLISTLGAKIGNELFDTGLHVTNPEALALQEILKSMVNHGCKYTVLETTSIGLHQGRVAGVKYDTAVLTNITSDHLDYHKNLENYRKAKAQLFKKDIDTVILNKDDDSFEFISDHLHKNSKVFSYGIKENSDFKAENIKPATTGFEFDIFHKGQEIHIKSKLLGLYNVSNVLAAVSTAFAHNIPFSVIKPAVEDFRTPEGRLERIDEGQSFSLFVDFAHTSNSIRNVLQTLKDVTPVDKKLIAVYGSAGLRDSEKRPEMGKWGGKLTDITIFTTDDPRTESVDDIIDVMAQGAISSGAKEVSTENLSKEHSTPVFARITDRAQAISIALSLAQKGDIVALLGKGHEKSLAIGNEEIPWSDQEVAKQVLSDLGFKNENN